MCRHYQAIKERERYARRFGVEPPVDVGKHTSARHKVLWASVVLKAFF
jgi:hypothetical protein